MEIEERNLKYRIDSMVVGVISNLRSTASNAVQRGVEINELKAINTYETLFTQEERDEMDALIVKVSAIVDLINALPDLKR